MKETFQNEKINRDDNAIDGQGSPCFGNTQPQEQFQQQDMQCVVNEMAQGKTRTVFDGWSCAESKIVSQQIICAETDTIPYRVREPCPNPQIEQQVYAIVNPSSNHTHDAKAKCFTDVY